VFLSRADEGLYGGTPGGEYQMRKTSFWDIATIMSIGTIVALGGAAGLQAQDNGKDQSRLRRLPGSVAILPPGVFSRPSTTDDLLSSLLPAVKSDRLTILKQDRNQKAEAWGWQYGIYRI
jgi:hypothetical protein